MTESILDSVKKGLGLAPDYEAFDADIIMHINSAFSVLNQLGVGPTVGYRIEDATERWSDFLGNGDDSSFVKTYVYLKVKLVFDPPTTGFVLTSIEKQITELEWRINLLHEDSLVDGVVVGDIGG